MKSLTVSNECVSMENEKSFPVSDPTDSSQSFRGLGRLDPVQEGHEELAAATLQELGRPVEIIGQLVHLITHDSQSPQRWRPALLEMQRQFEQVDETVRRLASLALPPTPQIQRVVLRRLWESFLKRTGDQWQFKGVAVEFQDGCDLRVDVDPQLVAQVLRCLLLLSVQSAGDRGLLRLSARRLAAGVEVRIRIQPRPDGAFDSMPQVDTLERAICRRILAAHGAGVRLDFEESRQVELFFPSVSSIESGGGGAGR